MVSQEIIKILIQVEDRATEAGKRIEEQMKRIGGSTKNSMQEASRFSGQLTDQLDKISNKLRDSGTIGKNSFNLLSTSEKKALDDLMKLDTTSQKVVQDLARVGSVGRNGFNQLSQSSQRAFTNISTGVAKANINLSRFGVNVTEVQHRISQMHFDSRFTAPIQKAKVEVSSLGVDVNSLKGKFMTVGTVAKNAFAGGVTGAIESVKGKISSLSSSINTIKTKLKELGESSRSAGGGLGFLNNAASMTVGMIGYDLFNSITQSARESINAAGNFQAFGKRLGMTGGELDSFGAKLNQLQGSFRKVDMNAVGASALELGVKLKLPKQSMDDLTKTVAVMSSAFVKEGRTQEDAILAVSDAMDGQFRRLQELGISQEMLMKNGWNGDLQDKNSLIQALNKTLDDMGFTETAQQINTLDDAWTALTVSGGQFIASILIPITPLITGVVDGITNLLSWIQDTGWAQGALLIGGLAFGILMLASAIDGTIITVMPVFITQLWGVAAGIGAVTIAGAPLWAIVAVIAAIAVAVYELGIAFGWWDDVGSMIDAIWAGLQRLWSAFINNPNVKAFLQDLSNAWDEVCQALQPVIQWAQEVWVSLFPDSASGGFDIVRAIIDLFGGIGKILGDVVNAASWFWSSFGGYIMAALNFITAPVQAMVGILRTIICILLGCSPGIVPALQKMYEVFVSVWNAVAGFIGGVVSSVVGVIQTVVDILTQVWEVLSPLVEYVVSILFPVVEMIVNIILTIIDTVGQLIGVFQEFLTGQMSLGDFLTSIWMIIGQMFNNILNTIINSVVQWAMNLWNSAVTAGQNFLNGVGQFISQLPGRVWNWIINTASRIASGVLQWVNNARQGAMNVVNNVMNYIKDLPNKVYQEFLKIPDRIRDALGGAVQAAIDFGKGILDGVLGALGIHSPGIVQNKIAKEFKDTIGKISDSVSDVKDVATEFGDAIVEGVGDPSLNMNIGEPQPLVGEYMDSAPTMEMAPMTMPINPDTSQLESGLAEVGATTDENNQAIASSFDLMTQSLNTSLTSMVSDNQLAYSSMEATDAATMQNIRNNMNTSMTLMRNNTNSQLNTMLNNTKTTNSRVTSSWAQMGSSVIKTSENIKTKSTGYFNQLSTTIGGFYRKLQNPSSWGAGGYGGGSGRPSRMRKVGHTNSMTSKIRNIFQRQNITDDTITLQQAKVNPFIDTTSLRYINPTNNPNIRLSLNTLAKYGAIKLPKGNFGGWDATNVNYKHIHDTANKWKMKTPNFGPYSTNGKFIVEQFETGVPKIDYNTFRGLAEDVYSQTHYDFYADSDKYGNWVTAFLSGGFNCSDGADSLIAMAHACGLSAHKVHGHWNNLGHFWAEVEGHKMDTTGWQQHRTWTPSQSHAGPAPRGFVTNPIEELKNIFKESENNNGSENIKSTDDPLNVNINLNENHTVNLENVPENINQDELEAIITEMFNERTNDDTWIGKLVNNPVFQELDVRVKEWRNRANNRNMGVIH